MKKLLSLLLLIALSAVFPHISSAASKLKTVKMVIPRGSVFVLSYFAAKDAGIFSKHGINVDVDPRPFGAFVAGLPSRQVLVGTYAGLNAIGQMNDGKDMVVIGGGLTSMQDVWVLKNSPIKQMTDLKGKKLGVFSRGAGAVKSLEVLSIDAFKLDITKDTKLIEVAGPALNALLDKGEIDAMFNLSSFSISAASQPDKYRVLFSPDDYWKDKTGERLVWSAPTVAWRDWVDEDRDRAKNLVAALHESWDWLRENSDKAVKKFGKLAGVKTSAEAATIKKMLKEGGIFLSKWDDKVVDAQWQFLELAKNAGVIKAVPAKDKHALVLR